MTLSALQDRGKKNLNPRAQWASKFQFSLAPTQILLADVAASMEIRGQTQTKNAWIPN